MTAGCCVQGGGERTCRLVGDLQQPPPRQPAVPPQTAALCVSAERTSNQARPAALSAFAHCEASSCSSSCWLLSCTHMTAGLDNCTYNDLLCMISVANPDMTCAASSTRAFHLAVNCCGPHRCNCHNDHMLVYYQLHARQLSIASA